MNKLFKQGLLCLLFSYSSITLAMEITIFPLKHKTSGEIVEVIKPLLGEGASVSGFNNKLIVKARSQKLEEVRWLISELDIPNRNLLIEVSVDQKIHQDTSPVGITGKISTGTSHVQLHTRHTNTDQSNDSNQRIRVIEGREAFIKTGTSVPIHQVSQQTSGGSTTQSYQVRYKDISQGFYALPKINGDNVTIDISQKSDSVAVKSGHFNRQSVSSIVSGKLGQWIEIGGIGYSRAREQQQLGFKASTSKQNSQSIWLRVSAVK